MVVANKKTRTAAVAFVVESIRDKIILQQYKSGTMMTEEELSLEHNTSRGTIRTALQILENEGMFTIHKNGRKEVAGITEKFVDDLYEMRKLLECKAIELIMKEKYVDYSVLVNAVNMFEATTGKPHDVLIQERTQANSLFHCSILEMSKDRPLISCWSIIEPTIMALAKFNSDTLDTVSHNDDYIVSHFKLLDMIVNKDMNVVNELAKHIDAAKKDTFTGLAETGCFSDRL